MPDVVDADVDKDDVGVLGQDVVIHAQVEIVHFIAANAGADEVIVGTPSGLFQGFFHSNNISARLGTLFGDRVSKEYNAGGFFRDHGSEDREKNEQRRL